MRVIRRAIAVTRPQIALLSCVILLVAWPARSIVLNTETVTLGPESLENLKIATKLQAGRVKSARSSRAIPADCRKTKCIALTFDDGPNPKTTAKILDSLERKNVVATFFVIGKKITLNAADLHRMHEDGDEIGNHSWDHADFMKLSAGQIKHELELTNDAVRRLGLPPPLVMRPPYGSFNLKMLNYLASPVVLWNIDPKDWNQKNPKDIVNLVSKQAHSGAIIVLHDKSVTADAVAGILHNLVPKYNLVTVSQLLNLKPTSRGIYFGHP